jgi:hypothetical protein
MTAVLLRLTAVLALLVTGGIVALQYNSQSWPHTPGVIAISERERSFGLNGAPNHPRFALTKEFVEGASPGGLGMRIIDSEAFGFMRERVTPLLTRQQPPTVQIKDSIAFKEDLILGFADTLDMVRIANQGVVKLLN